MFNFYLTYGAILFALKTFGIGEEKQSEESENDLEDENNQEEQDND